MIEVSQNIFSFLRPKRPKINLIILKTFFVFEYQTRWTTLVTTSLVLFMFIKFYLAKMCPIFLDSQLSCLVRYQKILREYSFEWKDLFNFTCHTMKFHNCHYPMDRVTVMTTFISTSEYIFFQLVWHKAKVRFWNLL